MSAGDVLPLLTGGGGAVAALVLGWLLLLGKHLVLGHSHREVVKAMEDSHAAELEFRDAVIADKDRQIASLNVALSRERERGDAVILAAHVTREALEGIRKAVT